LEALRRQVARLTRENEKQRRRLEFLVYLVALLRSGSVDPRTRSQLVQDNRHLGILWLCQILRMDRRSLYRWRRDRDGIGSRTAADRQVTELITRIHADSGGTYGAARVTAALRHRGLVVSRKRVARIMREHGIRGASRRRRRSLTRPDGSAPSAPDLLCRNFTASAPGLRIVSDITCSYRRGLAVSRSAARSVHPRDHRLGHRRTAQRRARGS
jgi:transposase InsO family protein